MNPNLSFPSSNSDPRLNAIDAHYSAKLLEHGYRIVSKIGVGAFSNVYLVISLKYNTNFVAKIITSPLCQNAYQEIQTLISITNKNVVRFYEYFEIECPGDKVLNGQKPQIFPPNQSIFNDNTQSSSTNFVMILENCPNGTLGDYIKNEGVLRIDKFLICADQIVSAIKFCHEKGVCHRDIKPSNLLIDKYCRIKLTDFGLSSSKTLETPPASPSTHQNDSNEHGSFFKHGNTITHHKSGFSYRLNVPIVGSLPFMAPESLKGESSNLFASDIWSLGMTFYSMLYGSLPWTATTRAELQKQVASGIIHYENTIHPKLIQFLTKILNVNPDLRPNIGEIEQMLNQVMRDILDEMNAKGLGNSDEENEIHSVLSHFCQTKIPIASQIRKSNSNFVYPTDSSESNCLNQSKLTVEKRKMIPESISSDDLNHEMSKRKYATKYRHSTVSSRPQPLRCITSTLLSDKKRGDSFTHSDQQNYAFGTQTLRTVRFNEPQRLFKNKTFPNNHSFL